MQAERIGQPANDPEPMNASVTFVRPNKVRIQSLDAMMVADGKKIRASVGSVANQVLELDAPANLAIGNLYLGDAFGDSPPDYAVDYQGERPWVWRSGSGANSRSRASSKA